MVSKHGELLHCSAVGARDCAAAVEAFTDALTTPADRRTGQIPMSKLQGPH